MTRPTSVTAKRNHALQTCISQETAPLSHSLRTVLQPSMSKKNLLQKDRSYLTWPQKLLRRANPGLKFLLLHQPAHNQSLTPQCPYQLLGLSSVRSNFAFSQVLSLSIFGSLLGIVIGKPQHPVNVALITPTILLKPLHNL